MDSQEIIMDTNMCVGGGEQILGNFIQKGKRQLHEQNKIFAVRKLSAVTSLTDDPIKADN